jgi:hypothetical protein
MGLALLGVVGSLAALLSLLPVVLLPFTTAVPPALCLLLALVDAGLLWFFFARAETVVVKTAVSLTLIAVSVIAVLLSQWFAATPPIVGADGQPLPGSIAELERVQLNGRQRHIPGWHELTWADVERVRNYYEPWQEERLLVDGIRPFAQNLQAALTYLQS